MQNITEILKGFDKPCPCGKNHTSALDMLVSGPGALTRLPELLARYDAKKAKNFAEADRIRDELKAQGIEITDIPGGAKWKHI